MIKLPDVTLDEDTLRRLKDLQEQIDELPTFAGRSDLAKRLFSRRNIKGNAIFDKIKVQLTRMDSGASRCAYCEDSVSDEVEHIFPKDLYPGRCFDWDNYVYACGPCNRTHPSTSGLTILSILFYG